MTDETHRKSQTFDPLDMGNYRIEKLPKMQKSRVERLLQRIGLPIAVLAFILIYWVADIPFINQLSTEAQTTTLTSSAMDRYGQIKDAIFIAAIILWITEAIPNYLTSLLVILTIVLTGVTSDKTAYAQLGHPVMWLNILSFILASMLVKTQVAKRFALWFVLKFGKNVCFSDNCITFIETS